MLKHDLSSCFYSYYFHFSFPCVNFETISIAKGYLTTHESCITKGSHKHRFFLQNTTFQKHRGLGCSILEKGTMFVTFSLMCLSFYSVWGSNGGEYEKISEIRGIKINYMGYTETFIIYRIFTL